MAPRTRIAIGLLVLPSALVIAIAVWFSASNTHTVVPGHIYRSAQLDARQLEELAARYGIMTVINLRGANLEKDWYQEQRGSIQKLALAYHDINMSAFRLPDVTEVEKLAHALQTAGRPILIHCRDGADRSGLASAFALLLDGKHTMQEARAQTSLRYRVTRPDSAGRQFLNQYSAWLLAKGVEHSPARLLAWIGNDYDDLKGNLRFIFDGVNDVAGKQGKNIFRVREGFLRAWGWAFDLRTRNLLENVVLVLDDRPLANTRYRVPRKDVAEVFGIPAIAASGWEVEVDVSAWRRKCYEGSLLFTRSNGSEWRSPPLATICLD